MSPGPPPPSPPRHCGAQPLVPVGPSGQPRVRTLPLSVRPSVHRDSWKATGGIRVTAWAHVCLRQGSGTPTGEWGWGGGGGRAGTDAVPVRPTGLGSSGWAMGVCVWGQRWGDTVPLVLEGRFCNWGSFCVGVNVSPVGEITPAAPLAGRSHPHPTRPCPRRTPLQPRLARPCPPPTAPTPLLGSGEEPCTVTGNTKPQVGWRHGRGACPLSPRGTCQCRGTRKIP